jgi:hypothetical protein
MELIPQTDMVVRYLNDFLPNERWVLTAIHTDRKGTIARTFRADTANDMKAWVEKMNLENHNIYFQICATNRDLNESNAQLRDVESVLWLHVDMDPKDGVSPEICKAQAEGILKKGKDGIPPPTVIVDSGGGVQAFWKLREPIDIGGSVEAGNAAKRHNQRLEVVFDADHCHNVNRLMRLPFTVNWPNALKRKKGRVPALSTVIQYKKENVYDIAMFPPLLTTQTQFSAAETDGLDIPDNVPRIDMDDLDVYEVSDRTKVICVQGRHPDEVKEKDNSRSAWLFDAVLRLVRRDVPDAIIYSIITDPDMGISSSVLDKANPDKEARRQIAKVKQFAIDPQLVEMNERHAVIRTWGGKCSVVEELYDVVMGRTQLVRTSFPDIKNAYCNRQVKVGEDKHGEPKYMELGTWWLKHKDRRQYDTLIFAPEKEVPGAYNLWRGFGVQAVPGDCLPFLGHIKENLCGGDDEYFNYLVRWMARSVQKPDRPGEVAVVLRGDQGTGKSFFAKEFGSLFGRHFLTVSDSKHLVGSFNAHLRDCVLLFGDEAFFAGDKAHESTLKTLITDNRIRIEGKGIDTEESNNFLHLILASNSDWVIPAGAVERRFFVLDVSNNKRQDSEYFRQLADHMQNKGGREALLHYLQCIDLSNWNVRAVPQTEALAKQKIWTFDPMQEWWFTKLDSGSIMPDVPHWLEEVECNDLTDDYLEYTRNYGVVRRGNSTKLGRFLLSVCPQMVRTQVIRIDETEENGKQEFNRRRPYVYRFPSFETCRYEWEQKMGKMLWSTTTEDEKNAREESERDD